MQYDVLDDEHKTIFQGIFAVAANPSDAGTLANLVTTVKKHFATEEVSEHFYSPETRNKSPRK